MKVSLIGGNYPKEIHWQWVSLTLIKVMWKKGNAWDKIDLKEENNNTNINKWPFFFWNEIPFNY